MDSLVLELQRLAMDPNAAVANVLRTALVVATKLDITDMRDWCEAEIRGYSGKDVPAYRKVEGQLRAWNPALGGFIHLLSQDAEVTKALATRSVVQPIGVLEKLLEGDETTGALQMPLSPSALNRVFADTDAYQLGIVPTVLIGRTQIFRILEAVGNAVLEWSLKLERYDMDARHSIARAPEVVGRLDAIVDELERLFPGRHFTPDGHLVGSLCEVCASYLFDIRLSAASVPGHDGKALDGRAVQVKATQGKSVAMRSEPVHLIVLRLGRDGKPEEIYNGAGRAPWQLAGAPQKNGQRTIGLGRLRDLMARVPAAEQLPRRAA